MRLVSNKKFIVLFLSSDKKFEINSTEKINLILSPEFYWVRKFDIPVSSNKDALRLLPTLFEDVISDVSELSYQVIKLEEGKFLSFAYNNKFIFEAIKKSKIPITNINQIYFAQNEFENFNSFQIDDKSFFYSDDGILVNIPNQFSNTDIDLTNKLNGLYLSPHKINIKLYNTFIGNKNIYFIYAFLLIISLLNLSKTFVYNKEISQASNRIEKLKERENLPKSMIQTKSILNNYSNKVSLEIKKREAILYIISNKKFQIKSLSVENNRVNLEYLSSNKNEVEKFISKRYKIVESKTYSFALKVSFDI